MKTNIHKFSCTDKSLAVVSVLRGRAYDRFKRSLSYLCKYTKNRCYEFSVSFYWQLAYLAKSGLNSNANLKMLAERYDLERNLTLFDEQEAWA